MSSNDCQNRDANYTNYHKKQLRIKTLVTPALSSRLGGEGD